ncbi:MAG: 50S ribosomal protein L6 [Chloroflexi bacterium]|nr:50S ribosomal protein L6 [Chloroflexota bacterium]
MSRIGKKPIPLPKGVTVSVEAGVVLVKGPKGAMSQPVSRGISVGTTDGQIVVTRSSNEREARALHGLTRALVANMVVGVADGFQKTLEIVGVGYRAQESGKGVVLQVGYAQPKEVQPMEGVTLAVEGVNRVHVRGIDRQRVGEMAARIRAIRPPNAYTGKGIRYQDEQVRLKPGKRAGRA